MLSHVGNAYVLTRQVSYINAQLFSSRGASLDTPLDNRRGVGAAPHDAPPSVKEGVGRFMTGRWGSATEAACAAEAGACEAQASRYVGLRRAYHIAPHMCVGTHDAARGRETTLHTPRNDGVVSID